MILITGSTGLVGRNLAGSLVSQGYRVRALLRPGSNSLCLKDLPVEKVSANPYNLESMKYALEGVDYIVHCAGVLHGLKYEEFFKGNVLYTQNLAEAAKKYSPNFKKFIYISSQAAAGPSKKGILKDESFLDDPISQYGVSKLEGEQKAKESGLPYVILRPSSIYGPMDTEFYPLFKMTKHHIQAVIGKGEAKINLLYIDDMVQAIELALFSNYSNKTYLVAGNGAFSMVDVVKQVKDTMGKKALLIKVPVFLGKMVGGFNTFWGRLIGKPMLLNSDKIKEFSQESWQFDTSLIRKELGFQPSVDILIGFKKTYEWYKKEKWL